MTKKEQLIIQYILYAMEYMKEASKLCTKLPEKEIKYLLEDYLYIIGKSTQELGIGLATLGTDISNSGFEKLMKKLMRKRK